jgi:hypothetical protein
MRDAAIFFVAGGEVLGAGNLVALIEVVNSVKDLVVVGAVNAGSGVIPAAVTVPLPNPVDSVAPTTPPIEADPVAAARAYETRSHTRDTAATRLHDVDPVQEFEPSLSIFGVGVQQRWPRYSVFVVIVLS